MKKLVFELNGNLFEQAFPQRLLDSRKDLLLIVMESCRTMMTNLQVENADNKFMLVVSDMNRLFFFTEKKMFSIRFPFHVNEYPQVRFDLNNIPIDSKMISDIMTMIEADVYDSSDALDFIMPIADYQDHVNPNIWTIMNHLMTYEIGYIRYDDDVEGYENACRAGMPKRHPRYHYDVNLDSQAVFKIGLSAQLSPDKFVDFLDDTKERLFAKK